MTSELVSRNDSEEMHGSRKTKWQLKNVFFEFVDGKNPCYAKRCFKVLT